MSVDVLREVFHHSQSEATDRCVLVALADAAHHDGVSWLPLEPSKSRRRSDPKCITHRANCSKREAIRAVQALQELGELEIRKAQRGRIRISVYRVIVGAIAELEVEYDRLPFELDRPFGRGDKLAPRHAQPTPAGGVPDSSRRGDKSVVDGVPFLGLRARVNRSFGADPSVEPSGNPSDENSVLVPADAGERGDPEQLRWALTAELGCRPATRSEKGAWEKVVAELAEIGATAEQVRERCAIYRRRWPNVALTPMALIRWWGMLAAAAASLVDDDQEQHERRLRWIAEVSCQLERDDAHWIVDQWEGIDDEQRGDYHERVDAFADGADDEAVA